MKKKVYLMLSFALLLINLSACGIFRKSAPIPVAHPNGFPPNSLLTIQEELAGDDYLGRGTGNNEKAQNLIRSHFNKIGLQKFGDSYSVPFEFTTEEGKPGQGTNLIGYLKGKTHPDRYIVIGAHYDHLGIVNDTIFNGADDNASGTSALITLAAYFSANQPHHSIIFAAFDAEELGIFGSIDFVRRPPVPLSKIILDINFDMISRNPKNEIYIVGTKPFPQFKRPLKKLGRKSPLKVRYGHDNPNNKKQDYWMYASDNGPFFEKGIPNITFSEEDHPDYHRPTDDFEKIHPVYYRQVVDLIRQALETIDSDFPPAE